MLILISPRGFVIARQQRGPPAVPVLGVDRPDRLDWRTENLAAVSQRHASHLCGLQRLEAADHHFAVALDYLRKIPDRFDNAPTAQVEFIENASIGAIDFAHETLLIWVTCVVPEAA